MNPQKSCFTVIKHQMTVCEPQRVCDCAILEYKFSRRVRADANRELVNGRRCIYIRHNRADDCLRIDEGDRAADNEFGAGDIAKCRSGVYAEGCVFLVRPCLHHIEVGIVDFIG